jgi:hypothetical protein
MFDTWRVLEALGDTKTAEKYRQESEDYRQVIERALDGSYHPDKDPPLLTLSLYSDEPEARDFYQLFASLLLDIDGLDRTRSKRYARFMEEDNRFFLGLCRFRGGYGPGGLDAIYTLGYLKHLIREGRVKRFLMAFYSYVAFNLDRDCFTSRETNVLYTADNMRDIKGTDPLPCSSAVPLNLLRHMLVIEEIDEIGMPTGDLRLFAGAPRNWFQASKTIALQDGPTVFGRISIRMDSHVDKGCIAIIIDPPKRNPVGKLKIRVPHPDERRIQRVTVDDRKHDDFDSEREMIEIPCPDHEISVEVYFQ